MYKNIPGVKKFFRFVFSKPFPFILTIDEAEKDGKITIRGLERIQVLSTSEYYNDRLFRGFSSLSIKQISYDKIYQLFFSSLISSQKIITESNSEIVAAFKQSSPLGIYYKIIYRIISSGKFYIVTFFNDNSNSEYKVVSVEEYIRKIEAGDYNWKCNSINTNSRQCESCESD